MGLFLSVGEETLHGTGSSDSGSSWECDLYKRINENKENAFQISLFKNLLKCKTRQNDFKMPLEGS